MPELPERLPCSRTRQELENEAGDSERKAFSTPASSTCPVHTRNVAWRMVLGRALLALLRNPRVLCLCTESSGSRHQRRAGTTLVDIMVVGLASSVGAAGGTPTYKLGIQVTADGVGTLGILPLTVNIVASSDDVIFTQPGVAYTGATATQPRACLRSWRRTCRFQASQSDDVAFGRYYVFLTADLSSMVHPLKEALG